MTHTNCTPQQRYEILVDGFLDPKRELWFAGLAIEPIFRPGEKTTTWILATLPDQSALLGLLRQLRDLGLELVSIQRLDNSKERKK